MWVLNSWFSMAPICKSNSSTYSSVYKGQICWIYPKPTSFGESFRLIKFYIFDINKINFIITCVACQFWSSHKLGQLSSTYISIYCCIFYNVVENKGFARNNYIHINVRDPLIGHRPAIGVLHFEHNWAKPTATTFSVKILFCWHWRVACC
jgi:hypothetical protein